MSTSASRRLAAAFWPGPLSLIFDAPVRVAVAVHGGGRSVAVRVPDDRVARALAEAFGTPITATSANLSGEPPARDVGSLGAVATDARVLVIDAGVTPGGAPSTIVDARGSAPVLVREGAVPWNRVLESLQG
jgi:L-threonylcarbamoyladenylate synthase